MDGDVRIASKSSDSRSVTSCKWKSLSTETVSWGSEFKFSMFLKI